MHACMCRFYSFIFYSFFGLFINLFYFFVCICRTGYSENDCMVGKFKGKQLTIHVLDMQRQNGGNDYGLFAITAATALYNGVDPASVIFEQSKMRTHLIKVIQRFASTIIPHKCKSLKKKLRSVIAEPLICACR